MPQLPSGLSTRPESFAPSGESNLRLQRAVESLNLNLDDELHRYRQNRSGNATVPATPARLQLRQNRKSLDLIALKTAATSTAVAAAAPLPNARLQEILGQASVPSSQAYPPKATVNQVRLSHGGTLTTYRQAPEDYLESTEALLGSVPPQSRRQAEAYTPSLARQLATPLGMGSLLLLLVGSAGFGYLVMSPQAVQHLTDSPLARRLRGQPTEGAADDAVALDGVGGQSDAGFKPMGPDLSEKEFMSLDLSNISNLPSANAPSAGQSTPVQAQVQAGLPLGEQVPPGSRPGVPTAAGSRVNAGVLRAEIVSAPGAAGNTSNAASAPRQAAPATRAPATRAPVAAPPAAQTAPPAAARPPQPLALNRTPAAPTPLAPIGSVAPPAPITQAPPQAAPSYYVVTDYSGAQSLESARSAVGDAYVRNFSSGTRIQMGAFSQESSARSLVNQLQGQGIPAQVISP